MKKVAVLVSDNLLPGSTDTRVDMYEREEEMEKLIPAFAKHGMELDLVRWREAAARAEEYDAYLPLLVWDYFESNETAFMAEMARASEKTKVFNSFSTLQWNSDKKYLEDLGKMGAPVIRTIILERATRAGVTKAFETLGTDKVVIKPQVGGGAWRQCLYTKGDPFPERDQLPPAGTMVQAFLPSVTGEGEYSFLYFGGNFSHAVVKRPKDGDYRIQSSYGGTEEPYTPTPAERDTAVSVLNALEYTPLYARIDLLRGLDGRLKLIELEMIEPYLYLGHAEGEGGDNKGALKLAEALARRLA